ncbi:hypothetical protein [Zoogloea sp.]|uniref:hypothetical protein n=1 Tax=Zoogloea sp. TaxID=49181 RepID=UPI002626E4F2|nr:hypothetical protein [Zoogloea sp.]MDD3354226.1 hypothetical protein [Zoogloea sp.]
MWLNANPFLQRLYCFTELVGRLTLAQVDAAQRMQFLAARLNLGVSGAYLRARMLPRNDVLSASERAVLEEQQVRLLEAGAEGCVTILRHQIDDLTRAQLDFVRQLGGLSSLPELASALPAPGALFSVWNVLGSQPGLVSARE